MTPMAGIWEVLRITADKSLSICAEGVFSIGFKKPKQVMENTDIHFSATKTFKATAIKMKRLPISTFCAFLLTVTIMLLPSAIEAKKFKWRTIPASKSGIVINIDGYEFQYLGTGWNAAYSKQKFLVKTDNYEQDLSIRLFTEVLAEGYYYDTVLGSLDGYVSGSRFTYKNNSPSIVSRWGGKTNKTDSSDGDQGFVAAKVELNHPTINTCYIVRYIPHWGTTYREEFNPSINLQLCSKGDLNLELSDGKKIFTIDDPNKKIGLNLSYQSLGQKIAALKNPTPSTTRVRPSISLMNKPLVDLCIGALSPDSRGWTEWNTPWKDEVLRRGLGIADCQQAIGVVPTTIKAKPPKEAEKSPKDNSSPNPTTSFGKSFAPKSLPPKSSNKADVVSQKPISNIQKRLEMLKKLEKNGLISSEEARKKREAILGEL